MVIVSEAVEISREISTLLRSVAPVASTLLLIYQQRIAATPVGGAAVAALSGIPDIDGLREFPEIRSSVVGY